MANLLWKIQIEGYGPGEPQTTLSNFNGLHILDYPTMVSETIDPKGGVSTMGELTFIIGRNLISDGLFAGVSSELVARKPITTLTAELNVADTASSDVVQLDWAGSTSPVTAKTIFVGDEAVGLDNITGTDAGAYFEYTLNSSASLRRGLYETTSRTWPAGTPVYAYNPRLLGRKVFLYVTSEDYSVDHLIGEYYIDGVMLSSDAVGWEIRCRSIVALLERVIGRNVQDCEVQNGKLTSSPLEHFDSKRWYMLGDEVSLINTNLAGQVYGVRRAEGGTALESSSNNTKARQIFFADKTTTQSGGYDVGSFLYQDPDSVETSSRATGDWVQSCHPVALILNILLSNYDLTRTDPDKFYPRYEIASRVVKRQSRGSRIPCNDIAVVYRPGNGIFVR